jgi:flavin-dependent dehydrogenase
MNTDYDVVVVGARCAGAGTAMLLARGGLSVLAVDRARYGTDTLSTHALTRAGVRQLSRWGVLDEIRAAGTPRVDRVVYHYGDEVVEVPIKPRGDVDGLYAPRRQLLDRVLVDAAARAGVRVRHRTGVRQLLVEDGRVAGVELASGETVRARLVIGADGARSTVAAQVGARLRYAAPHSSATIYTYVDGLPADAYRNYFRPGLGGVAVVPTGGGQANVSIGVPADRLPRPGEQAGFFIEVIATIAPELARLVAAAGGRAPTFVGLPGFVRRGWGRGWALVGDAVYFKDPISAHGMTDALIGAELLARAVLEIAGGAYEPAALAGYARQRWRLTAPMIPAVEHVASYQWSMSSLQQAHRTMNAAMRGEWNYLDYLQAG